IPEVASNARGKAIVNLLTVEQGENVRALLTVKDYTEAKYVVMVTRAGRIKKTELSAFSNVRASGMIAIDINEGDDLYAVRLTVADKFSPSQKKASANVLRSRCIACRAAADWA